MNKVLQCDCGFDARADDMDGLVAEVRSHAWEVHGMALSHDEAQVLASRALPRVPGPQAAPRQAKTSPEEQDR